MGGMGTGSHRDWMRAAREAITPISAGAVSSGDSGTLSHTFLGLFTNYFLAYPLSDFYFSNHPEKAVESCIYRRVLHMKKLRFREVKQPVQGLLNGKW